MVRILLQGPETAPPSGGAAPALSHTQKSPPLVPLVPRVQPFGLVGRLGWQRLQRAQRRGVCHGNGRVTLQQRPIMLEEGLLCRRTTAGEELLRMRADRCGLADWQVLSIGERV